MNQRLRQVRILPSVLFLCGWPCFSIATLSLLLRAPTPVLNTVERLLPGGQRTPNGASRLW